MSESSIPSQHLRPKSRTSPAVTSADPVLTRLALGRSNDGTSFGMFLQVFADGTVVDSEGVHHLRPAELKPLLDSVQSGELSRLRGHCGAPSTDFIEYIHVVVYERRFGRLTANSFSYSGSSQGCDHAIRHLHTVVENLQAKLSRSPTMESLGAAAAPSPMGASPLLPPQSTTPSRFNAMPGPAPSPGGVPSLPATIPGGVAPVSPSIPLTPIEPSR